MTSSAHATTLPKITNQAISVSNKNRWTGRILSTVAVLFMLFDSFSHLTMPRPVADAFVRLGYPQSLGAGIGILGLVCAILYAIPRTSIVGAILLTGFLGGATAANLRVADPLFETLFPVLFGVLTWAGIILRDDRLGRLVPFRADADRAFPEK
jgi:hypothetical protein